MYGMWGALAGSERNIMKSAPRPSGARADHDTHMAGPELVRYDSRVGGRTQYILLAKAEKEGLIDVSVRHIVHRSEAC